MNGTSRRVRELDPIDGMEDAIAEGEAALTDLSGFDDWEEDTGAQITFHVNAPPASPEKALPKVSDVPIVLSKSDKPPKQLSWAIVVIQSVRGPWQAVVVVALLALLYRLGQGRGWWP